MLFHFFITFYANRSGATRKSKSVFDVSSERDFLRQSKHISGMFDNEKVKGGWCGEGIVYADASLYQKFASVGGLRKRRRWHGCKRVSWLRTKLVSTRVGECRTFIVIPPLRQTSLYLRSRGKKCRGKNFFREMYAEDIFHACNFVRVQFATYTALSVIFSRRIKY